MSWLDFLVIITLRFDFEKAKRSKARPLPSLGEYFK
jgi:hypothetical protein